MYTVHCKVFHTIFLCFNQAVLFFLLWYSIFSYLQGQRVNYDRKCHIALISFLKIHVWATKLHRYSIICFHAFLCNRMNQSIENYWCQLPAKWSCFNVFFLPLLTRGVHCGISKWKMVFGPEDRLPRLAESIPGILKRLQIRALWSVIALLYLRAYEGEK